MRTKKALLNTITSLLLQFVTIICGFILPRMILSAFGSEVNGAVSSITQFLGYISLLEAGVGGVTRAALYKPLSDQNTKLISGIVNATQSFFQKLAGIFVVYAIALSFAFKYISNTKFDLLYTGSLVIIIAISTFVQYYFGITNSIVLQADQRNYISTSIQIFTIVLNTIVSIILIKLGFSIHIVKLFSTGVFVLRPLMLSIFVRKRYMIDKSVPPDNNALSQRWNGLGQHIAFFLHNNTDIMVTTIFLGLKWVSVYNVYYMVGTGIKNLVNAVTGGSEAAYGNMLAKNEKDILDSRFKMMETLGACVISSMFSTAGLLIVDFIKLYTRGITDIDYNLPIFGSLLILSEALHCIKQQYHHLVLAAGHYKETQKGAFIEAGLNILLSIILVNVIGITGVIIATIISTSYRMIDYVFHLKTCILERNIRIFIKRIIITFLSSVFAIFICSIIPFWKITSYAMWGLKALIVFLIVTTIILIWNYIFYKNDLLQIIKSLKQVFISKQNNMRRNDVK